MDLAPNETLLSMDLAPSRGVDLLEEHGPNITGPNNLLFGPVVACISDTHHFIAAQLAGAAIQALRRPRAAAPPQSTRSAAQLRRRRAGRSRKRPYAKLM